MGQKNSVPTPETAAVTTTTMASPPSEKRDEEKDTTERADDSSSAALFGDESSSILSMSSKRTSSSVGPILTRQRLEDREVDVYDLATRAGIPNPQERWPMRTTPYVFISHTGQDNLKDELARPTRWFLTEICKIDAFLDDMSTTAGTEKSQAILAPAYECTHALVILSHSYREREFCVQELNTFVLRYLEQQEKRRASECSFPPGLSRDGRNETTLLDIPESKSGETTSSSDDEMSFAIIPALFGIRNAKGYAEAVKDFIWISSNTTSIPDFLIGTLWPKLQIALKLNPMSESELERILFRYVETQRGHENRTIPPCLERFATLEKRSLHGDFPKEIIFDRLAATDNQDVSSISTSFGRCRSVSSIQDSSRSDAIKLKTVKEFWKLEPETVLGKLVSIEQCTVSTMAEFTVGAPWIKAGEHLGLRQLMDAGTLPENEEAKGNCLLAITAGQMVLRTGEIEGGYRYLGLYQSIVRNSIPLFATSSYYDEVLSPLFKEHSTNAIDCHLVGKVVELPESFVTAFVDYMRYSCIIKNEIVPEHEDKTVCAILIGDDDNMTAINYKRNTPYLDGDIWVAVESEHGGDTTFKSRFTNLADSEDVGVAVESLKQEIKGQRIVSQFDLVDRPFREEYDSHKRIARLKMKGAVRAVQFATHKPKKTNGWVSMFNKDNNADPVSQQDDTQNQGHGDIEQAPNQCPLIGAHPHTTDQTYAAEAGLDVDTGGYVPLVDNTAASERPRQTLWKMCSIITLGMLVVLVLVLTWILWHLHSQEQSGKAETGSLFLPMQID